MYRCEHTGKLIPAGTPMNRVVVERREMTYENKIKKGRHKGEIQVTRGWEIAKEIIVGPDAYKELTGLEPRRGQPKAASVAPPPRKRFDTRPTYRKKKWNNPKSKGKQSQPAPEKRGPVVEVINRADKRKQR